MASCSCLQLKLPCEMRGLLYGRSGSYKGKDEHRCSAHPWVVGTCPVKHAQL